MELNLHNMKKIAQVRLVYDRKHIATKRTDKSPRLGVVQLEVMFRRKRRYFSTGVRVYQDEWKGTAPYYIIGRTDAFSLNKALSEKLRVTMERVVALGDSFVLESFMADEGSAMTFLDFMEMRIAERRMVDSTRRQHKVALDILREYGKIINFFDLTRPNILEFDQWIMSRKGHGSDRIRQTSVYGIHKRIRVYVNEAMIRGYITSNPYFGVKIDRGKYRDRVFLTEEEMNRLRSAVMQTESLERVRDLAVFQMFTGLSYSDLVKFDFKKAEQRDGHWFVRDVRKKTGEMFWLLLLSPAVEVLEKYDFALPFYTREQYNMRLKIVMDAAGINKSLSSHCLRHTFATYALNKGLSTEVVGKILGQKKVSTTQIYAKLLGKTVEEAMLKLDDSIK